MTLSTPDGKGCRLGLLADDELSRLNAESVVLIAVGSIEPHAHLPLATDTMIASAILERVAEANDNTVLFPPIPVGFMYKYAGWTGAVWVSAGVMEGMMLDICRGLARSELRKLFVMSGHDENREPVLTALREASLEVGTQGVYCDWIDLAMSVLPTLSTSRQEGHASEIQTSVFQYLYPELPLDVPPPKEAAADPAALDPDDRFAAADQAIWVRPAPRDQRGAYSGDPGHASPRKGELVVEHIVRRTGQIIGELREQRIS